MDWTLTLRGGHDDQVLVEPDRRGVVEAVAEDFGALATQVLLQWAGGRVADQVTAVGELGGTVYGNDAIGNDTDIRLGVTARRLLSRRLLVEGGASGWRFRRTNLEDFNVDMIRLSGRASWTPARALALSGGGRFNRLNFVDRYLPPDTSGVGGDGEVVVTPIGPQNERDDQLDLWGEIQGRVGTGAYLALDLTYRWTDSNEPPVPYRGPSVMVRFSKQVTGRLDMTGYVGHTWRTFRQPYPVRLAGGEVVLQERNDKAWQFGFGLERPVTSRVRLYGDGYWTEQSSSIEDFAFDQARFSVGVGVSLASSRPPRFGAPAGDPGFELAPLATTGGVRFRYRDSGARAVSVVGDFNGWDPDRNPLVRIEEDLWEVVVPLGPGMWRYAFVTDGEWRRPPDAPRYEDDGFGGENGVLEVQTTGSQHVTGSAGDRPTQEYTEFQGLGPTGRE